MTALRIGINALYLIPAGVGGTEIYLRRLPEAFGRIDSRNEYLFFMNRESADALPAGPPRFHQIPCAISARSRPDRILWEQTAFLFLLSRQGVDVLFNPGFRMPLLFEGPSVTVFHDLRHKRHPEYFRTFDLPFWNLFLWAAAKRSPSLIAVSGATSDDLERYYPGVSRTTAIIPHGAFESGSVGLIA